MNRTISAGLRTTFLVHAIVALVFGAALWLIPGRFFNAGGLGPRELHHRWDRNNCPGNIVCRWSHHPVAGRGAFSVGIFKLPKLANPRVGQSGPGRSAGGRFLYLECHRGPGSSYIPARRTAASFWLGYFGVFGSFWNSLGFGVTAPRVRP